MANSLAGKVLLGVVMVAAASACGGGAAEPVEQGRTPEAIVPVESPELNSPEIRLETSMATTYYPVEGLITEQIFASIEANGPQDDFGRQGSGLTSVEWEYFWVGDKAPSAACSIRELTISADIVVELPQHIDEVSLSPVLLEKWTEYVNGVAVHEQRHVDIYLAGADAIKSKMEDVGVAANCEELTATIDSIWSEEQGRINLEQETFHHEEDVRLAARRDPINAQIEANRAELIGIQGQIAVLDGEIARLSAEIAVFDTEVANVDAQIKQITDQFPNDLPDTVRQRLGELIEQSNDLIATYNGKVNEHNAAIVQRSQLNNDYDRLLAVTNQLVDEYNWTR